MKKNKVSEFIGPTKFFLFVTSYIPLFFCIILRQCYFNRDYLNWGGLNSRCLMTFIEKFGLSWLLLVVILLSIMCFPKFLKQLHKDSKNGDNVTVISVNNRNSDALGYIATYIFPFLFQSFSNVSEWGPLVILLIVIYPIYTTSSLLMINPVLCWWYSIYEITFKKTDGRSATGLVISRDKYIFEEDSIKIYSIGYNLYFLNRVNGNGPK